MRQACVLAILILLGCTGCAAPKGAAAVLSRDDRWRGDIDCLARELPRLHKNAFFKCAKASFDAAAAQVRERVPRLKDHEIIVEMLRLIAMIGDGHTQAQNYSQVGGFHSLPIMFEWLHDGYYVTRTVRSHAGALGLRLARVGKTPVDEAVRRLAETFPSENDMQVRRRVPYTLRCPELVHACALAEGLESAEFTFVDAKGDESRATIAVTPPEVEVRWVHAAEVVTLAEQQPQEAYWFKLLPDRGAAYLAYNSCQGFGTFRSRCSQLFRAIDDAARAGRVINRLIIDLRRNGGGNSMVLDAIHWHLAWRRELREPGRILVLVGRGTFSSAMMNAIQLRQRHHAVLIGEPTGGSPNSYGEIKPLTLPNSRLVIMYSTAYFELEGGGSQTVTPDVLVEQTIEGVLAGLDPVLDAALAYQPAAATKSPKGD